MQWTWIYQAIYMTAVALDYHLLCKRLDLEHCFMGKTSLWSCIIVSPLHVGTSQIHWKYDGSRLGLLCMQTYMFHYAFLCETGILFCCIVFPLHVGTVGVQLGGPPHIWGVPPKLRHDL